MNEAQIRFNKICPNGMLRSITIQSPERGDPYYIGVF